MKNWPWTRVLVVVAACAVIAGVVTLVVASMQTVSFGWFATNAVSGEVFTPFSSQFVSQTEIIGYIVLALGLIGLAFWAGVLVGSRRRF